MEMKPEAFPGSKAMEFLRCPGCRTLVGPEESSCESCGAAIPPNAEAVTLHVALPNAAGGTRSALCDAAGNIDSAVGARTCTADGCDTTGKLKCGGCGFAYYCSGACQRAHWKAHKPACKAGKAERKAAAARLAAGAAAGGAAAMLSTDAGGGKFLSLGGGHSVHLAADGRFVLSGTRPQSAAEAAAKAAKLAHKREEVKLRHKREEVKLRVEMAQKRAARQARGESKAGGHCPRGHPMADSTQAGRSCSACERGCRGEHEHCARCDFSYCRACHEAEGARVTANVMADPEIRALMMDGAFEARLKTLSDPGVFAREMQDPVFAAKIHKLQNAGLIEGGAQRGDDPAAEARRSGSAQNDALRFGIGAAVECFLGEGEGWASGEIVAHDFHEEDMDEAPRERQPDFPVVAAYQVCLCPGASGHSPAARKQERERVMIFVPFDDDEYVRSAPSAAAGEQAAREKATLIGEGMDELD